MTELEGAEDGVERVTADVAERAGPEIPPAAPDERQIGRMIGPAGRRAEPQVPFESWRHRWRIFWPAHTLGPVFVEKSVGRPIGPNVSFADGPDGIVPNH